MNLDSLVAKHSEELRQITQELFGHTMANWLDVPRTTNSDPSPDEVKLRIEELYTRTYEQGLLRLYEVARSFLTNHESNMSDYQQTCIPLVGLLRNMI